MKKQLSIIIAAALLISLAACGSDRMATKSVRSEEAPAPMVEYAYAAEDSYSADSYGIAMAAGANSLKSTESPSESLGENTDKIIYSADATVETTDFEDSLAKLDTLIKECGGWVESSSLNGANYYDLSRGRTSLRSAYYKLRLPSEQFDTVLQGLNTLGNVPYSHIYTDNITAQYYDTQARLESLKTQEQSLLRLMEKAESVEDIIKIEDKLTDVRYSIESLESTIRNWDRQVEYSSLSLSVNEVEKYTPAAVVNPGFGERLVTAVKDGLESAGDFLSNLVLGLVEVLPTLVIIAAAGFGVFVLIRRSVRKRKAKKQQEDKDR